MASRSAIVLEIRVLLMAIVRWASMDFARQASAAVFLVTVTLLLQCAGMACPHPLGTGSHCTWDQGARLCTLGRAYGAFYNLDDCPAHSANSAVGRFLSLALSSLMGGLLLFLVFLLFSRWIWRHCSPASLAPTGPGGEHYWSADVWPFRELSVRHRG